MKSAASTWEEAVLWLRDRPEHAQLVRDCYFDDPLPAAAERFHRSTEWAATRGILSTYAAHRRGEALDVGAGRGISSYALASDGWTVTALEPDASDVVGAGAIRSLCRSTGIGIEVSESFGEDLPFPDASFDLVYARQVLHHASDLGAFCGQVRRVLRPGGLFFACRDHVVRSESGLARFLEKHPLHSLYGGENARRLAEYSDAIRAAGLRLERVYAPHESDVNLFPDTVASRRRNLARSFHLPDAFGPLLLAVLSRIRHVPGELYSFAAIRGS